MRNRGSAYRFCRRRVFLDADRGVWGTNCHSRSVSSVSQIRFV